MSNKEICVAAQHCIHVGTENCNNVCPAFIALHGFSGKGGRVVAADIPKQYAHITVKNSPVRESEAAIYGKLDEYVKTFKRQFEDKQIKGLYIYSPTTGNGKTTTAAALANEYLVRHVAGSAKRGLQPKHNVAYFLDVNEWQTTYNEFNRPNVPKYIAEPAAARYYEQGQLAKEAAYLVIDDIGVRDSTEGFRGDLHRLVNHRNVQELPTVYTSNIPLQQLVTVFGEKRLVDRIRDMTEVVTFTGESKRGRRK
jgi:DNA replication protein DnaC